MCVACVYVVCLDVYVMVFECLETTQPSSYAYHILQEFHHLNFTQNTSLIPGSTQLSVTCSTEKLARPIELSRISMSRVKEWQKDYNRVEGVRRTMVTCHTYIWLQRGNWHISSLK